MIAWIRANWLKILEVVLTVIWKMKGKA